MKKTSILKILLILTINLILIFLLVKVKAYDGELNNNKIRFGNMVVNGVGSIFIYNTTDNNYQISFQPIELTTELHETIIESHNTYDTEVDVSRGRINTKRAEVDNLREVFSQKVNEYNTAVSEGVTGEALENIEAAREQAEQAYYTAMEEESALVEQENTRLAGLYRETIGLYPNYNDSNWKNTTKDEESTLDNHYEFSVDITQYNGKKPYMIWAKLVESDNTTSYNAAILSITGSATPKVDLESFTLDKTELSLNIDERYTLIPTFTPADATNKVINWTSSNEDIATVLNGVVTGKSIGTTTITATSEDGGFVVTCEVTVLGGKTQNNKEDNKEEDDTTAPTNLPKAGGRVVLTVIIVGIIVLAIIYYKKYSKYNDVK